MKKALFFLVFLFTISLLSAQNNKDKHSFSIELIPLSQQFTAGSGFHFNYQLEKPLFSHLFTLGTFYTSFEGLYSAELLYDLDDPDIWTTSVDIENGENSPFYEANPEQLEELGFYHFNPGLSYRLNRFLSYEFLYKPIENRFSLYAGLGLVAGLTNKSVAFYILDGEISGSNYIEESSESRIIMYARTKYLYFAPSGKIMVNYKITENFLVGISGGIHYMLNRDFTSDYPYYYLGLSARLRI